MGAWRGGRGAKRLPQQSCETQGKARSAVGVGEQEGLGWRDFCEVQWIELGNGKDVTIISASGLDM